MLQTNTDSSMIISRGESKGVLSATFVLNKEADRTLSHSPIDTLMT